MLSGLVFTDLGPPREKKAPNRPRKTSKIPRKPETKTQIQPRRINHDETPARGQESLNRIGERGRDRLKKLARVGSYIGERGSRIL